MAQNNSSTTVIIVMGASGAGKSTFIDQATNSTKDHANHRLKPGPGEIRAVSFLKNSSNFVLVDTPGFGAKKSNIEILVEIVEWVKTNYSQTITSLRVIYLHKITDTRLVVSPLRILKLLATVAKGRGGAVASVVVATTMWGGKTDAAKAAHRQHLLEGTEKLEEYSVMHFENTFDSAWDITNSVVGQTPVGLQGLLEEAVSASKTGKVAEGIISEAGLIELCKRFLSRVTGHGKREG